VTFLQIWSLWNIWFQDQPCAYTFILQEVAGVQTGVKVDLPVLTDKDIRDLQEFACKHNMDYVAASFVQSAADVRFIRSVLDEAGGFEIKIISKIENQEGLKNFKEILKETDGVMIARGACCVPRCRKQNALQSCTV
jgi:pyruvate kinase